MHAAQHDAVNGARPRYETYVSTLRSHGADAEAAAAAAAHAVLVAFFPANRAALDARLGEPLSAVPDGAAADAGVALGRAVGGIVLAARADDGYARDYDEVKLVGQDSSRARTAEQTHLAHFWVEPTALAGVVTTSTAFAHGRMFPVARCLRRRVIEP